MEENDESFGHCNLPQDCKEVNVSSEKVNHEPDVFGALDEARRRKKALLCPDKLRIDYKLSAKDVNVELEDIQQGPVFDQVQRRQKRNITVESDDPTFVPVKAIKSFADAALYFQLLANASARGFRRPTAIQAAAIPHLLRSGRDLLARADTGSGKTAAFLLPLLHQVRAWKIAQGRNKAVNTFAPYAVVLTPSKELALQIYQEALLFARKTGVRTALAVGEVNMKDSIKILKNGCDLVVGTQGRIVHYFFGIDNNGTMSHLSFANMRTLVLDEADRVFKDVNFSQMLGRIDYLLRILEQSVRSGDAPEAKTGPQKRVPNTIVYASTKRVVDLITVTLLKEGYRALPVTGDWSMTTRAQTVNKMKNGQVDVIVATDVASRGLNIPNVEMVINFHMPTRDYNEYVHRVGRCGRLGNVGLAISFFDPDTDREVGLFLSEILSEGGHVAPDFIRQAAQQVLEARDFI